MVNFANFICQINYKNMCETLGKMHISDMVMIALIVLEIFGRGGPHIFQGLKYHQSYWVKSKSNSVLY